ncbi:glycoside hydrolase family 13 protein [Actinomycetaceae bacterium WB03_NA08]|uniref:Glycoside hydrolase family 13 protein n=1 Tax=Scrofimicrobium canadense TaxID=2652290 RepID=A0A6N7W7H6_9ACTO|nr:alpha-amylase family glycosyl hydrolase [Scrofimicrobium canadense]MSS84206.1 glycoside hydrolase family 13 protein [Scrofimicrobium canadense]
MTGTLTTDAAPQTIAHSPADWWKKAVFYQVYPRSFADSNNDGIGDLPGLLSKLDYLKDLGIDALWISPFYPSPQWDQGYDVADYFSIDPSYGSLEDFDVVLSEAHQRGMRVIIDVVPNHSSSEHEWFQAALAASPGSPERDRYIFRHSSDGAPNNWGSIFGGPAWSQVEPLTGREEDHGWWYLHMFDSHQPDFNWENQDVWDLFDRYLHFWLERGVDGFRVDVAQGLVKAEGLPDDEIGPERYAYVDPSGNGRTQRAPDRGPYFDQDGVHEIYRHWRTILDQYGPDRIMVAEATIDDPVRKARYARADEMNQAFNFDILSCGWNSEELRHTLHATIEANREVGAVNTWVLSNHDQVRHATRFGYPYGAYLDSGLGPIDPRPDEEIGLERALAFTTFLLGLPGAMYLYNGEELGLPEVLDIPANERQDPTWKRTNGRAWGRDGCRVPLPWSSHQPNSGFGTGKPWLPMPKGWEQYAADLQEINPASCLNKYRQVISLRRQLDLGAGDFHMVPADEDLVVVRNGDITVAINLGMVARPVEGVQKALVTSSLGTETLPVKDQAVFLPPNTAAWLQAE